MIFKRLIPHPKLKQVFGWFVKKTFHDLQIRNGGESSYLTDLLSEFARTERVFKVRDAEGRPLRTIVELLEVRQKSEDRQGIELDQHIGDYSLFMTGFFVEFLRRGGFVNLYREEGMRAYWRLSNEIRFSGMEGSRLFGDLAADFDRLSAALHYLRDTYIGKKWVDDPSKDVAEVIPLHRA